MSNDLGCVKLQKIERSELATTQWTEAGIVLVWEDHLTAHGQGCWSAVGQASGFGWTSTTYGSASATGAPDNYQVVALDSSCDGLGQATLEHEILHALGVDHEHNRPDRDNYLTINLSASIYPDQYEKQAWDRHMQSNYPFELDSVMTYCSFCSAANPNVPVAFLHPQYSLNGEQIFSDGAKMTTTDALQIQYKYCQAKGTWEIFKQ